MKNLATVALLLLTLLPPRTRAADEVAPLVKKLEEKKSQVLQSEVDRRHVLAEIYKIQRQIRKYSQERGYFEFERRSSQRNVSKISQLISKLDGKINNQRQRLKRRLHALYKFGGQNLIRAVFSSQNPTELDRQLRVIETVTRRDYFLLNDYRETLQDYQQQQKKLGDASHRLAVAEKRYQQKELELNRFQKEKGELLKRIDAEKVLQLTHLQRLRQETLSVKAQVATNGTSSSDNKLEKLNALEAALAPSFYEMKGNLRLPLSGALVQPFGDFFYRPRGVTLRHKGIFLAAPLGTSVQASFQGTVKFAGSLNGFEKVVIVAHGDHYFSVYGSLTEISVKAGDQIKTSAEIGKAGTNPFGLGTGAYVEVRHFSEPLNPMEWFPSAVLAPSVNKNPFPSSQRTM